jgi:carbamoyltransferase
MHKLNTYILGIHMGHDGAAALFQDGNLIGAVQEERFNRIKNFSGYPTQSIGYLLNKVGISKSSIKFVCIAGKQLGKELPLEVIRGRLNDNKNKLKLNVTTAAAGFLKSDKLRKSLYSTDKASDLLRKEIRKLGFENAQFEFFDHHACHAASAFYSSPFSNALILTQDGKGDGSSGTIFEGCNTAITELSRQSDVDSIGQIYAEVTRFLGFRPNRHEGKITGLAAYGNPRVCNHAFSDLVDEIGVVIKRSDALEIIEDWADGITIKDKLGILANHPDILPYEINAAKLQKWFKRKFESASREDISAAVQNAVEDWVVELCTNAVNQYSREESVNICLAGGLFANVKINQRVRENIEQVDNVYVQPSMGDSGLALGAAQLCFYQNQKNATRLEYLDHAYLGPDFSDSQIEEAFNEFEDLIFCEKSSDIEQELGKLLHQGLIIGRFHGRMEWGPRALGNRSILIRPIQKGINDTVNERLRRSEFMPFAPSVLDYRAKDYFKGYRDDHYAADYMTITYDVFPEMVEQIEAVVHVDNTARPQVVKESVNPSYYKILKAYEEHSGIGCIVNTSFNLHEEPIICSPRDALRALQEGAVDVLAIENYLVKLKIGD